VIYVTVGGHHQGFNRLIVAADLLAPHFNEEMVIQRGASTYIPKNARSIDFVDFSAADDFIKNARVVVSHAGAGTLIAARKHGVPVVVVPRRAQYKEHFNDHQLDICAALAGEKRPLVHVLYDLDLLENAVRVVLNERPVIPAPAVSGKDSLVAAIRRFIEQPTMEMINPVDISYGSTHRIRKICQGLRERGWDIEYVESNYTGTGPAVSVRQTNNAPGFLAGTLHRVYLALFKRYDILFTQTITPLTVGTMLAAKLRGKKVVVDWDDLSWVLQKNRFRSWLVRFCEHTFMHTADVVFVPNRYLLEYGRDKGARQIVFAPHGVDFDRFDPSKYSSDAVRAELGLNDKPTLGFLASFTTGGVGDLDVVYRAVKKVQEQRPNLNFLVMGGGPLYEEYRRLAEGMGLRNTVFTGLAGQETIPRWLSAVDVGLIFMRDNINNRMKTSLKVGEYLAMNRPVVGHLEGQTADDFGSLCTTCAADENAFVTAILGVLGTLPMVVTVRDELMKRYTWESSVAVVDAVLKERCVLS
jgi:UDP-N-acetylglucosamine transferase subunit ALG13